KINHKKTAHKWTANSFLYMINDSPILFQTFQGFTSTPLSTPATSFLSADLFDQIVARIGPEILCQIAPHTLGSAASGLKWAVAKATPKPEFCMPTSSEMARRSVSLSPIAIAVR